MSERLAREIAVRARHPDERKLERQPRVAALAHVLDRDGQEVDEADHRGLRKLVRLLAQTFARLLGEREGIGYVAEVLHEQQVS